MNIKEDKRKKTKKDEGNDSYKYSKNWNQKLEKPGNFEWNLREKVERRTPEEKERTEYGLSGWEIEVFIGINCTFMSYQRPYNHASGCLLQVYKK